MKFDIGGVNGNKKKLIPSTTKLTAKYINIFLAVKTI